MSEQIETTDRKIYRRRPMRGLKADHPAWAQLGDPDGLPLSALLTLTLGSQCKGHNRLFLCGSPEQMSREYCEEPLRAGWEFARPFLFGFRSPIYRHKETGEEVSVKLVGKSWLPDCEDMRVAIPAWKALANELSQHTQIPLLSTPSKTGQALLLESLPKGVDFPALPDDLAKLIRAVSPQHRLQVLQDAPACFGYDGRWMYAGAALADRLPVGEPRKVGGFVPYQPGWYRVVIRIPETWNHIGLLPERVWESGEKVWNYPNTPGLKFETWASEPELTLAINRDPEKGPAPCWEIMEVIDGYAFDKGRPLAPWAKKLIAMRDSLSEVADSYGATPETRSVYRFAAKAPREILNHTIGSFHVNTFEREGVVSASEWKELVAQWGRVKVRTLEKLRGGKRRVTYPAQHSDRLSIYMPHWSATIWALERAWIAKHALLCDPAILVEIRGDAVYSTAALPFKDDGHLSQLRPKEA